MAANTFNPLPPVNTPIVKSDFRPQQPFAQWLSSLDTIVRNKTPRLLNTLTASASASLSDTTSLIQPGFTAFRIIANRLVFSNNAINLALLVSTNGGSSYDNTAGHYSLAALEFDISPASNPGVFTTRAGVNFNTISNNRTLTCDVTIFNANVASLARIVGQANYENSTGPGEEVCLFGGVYSFATGVNAFQFLPSAGTITSGSIEVHGIP